MPGEEEIRRYQKEHPSPLPGFFLRALPLKSHEMSLRLDRHATGAHMTDPQAKVKRCDVCGLDNLTPGMRCPHCGHRIP